jgi:hypothetical protein
VAWSGAAEASPTRAPAGGGTKAGGGVASRRLRRRDRPLSLLRVVNSRYGAKQKDARHFDFRGRGKNVFSACMNSVKSFWNY